MIYFLRLIRIKNLLITVCTMFAIRYWIIIPLLGGSAMPILDFWLMIAATVLLGAAGYVINDYFDQKIDKINRPDKVIIGTIIHRRTAILLHWIFNSLGLLIGLFLTFRLKMWWILIVYFFVTVIFWVYSTWLKKQVSLSTVSVSFLAFLVPFQVLLFEIAWGLRIHEIQLFWLLNEQVYKYLGAIILTFSIFAFLTNFIREIVKDLEDIRGDARYGCKTLPVTMGPVSAKLLIFVLTAILLSGIVIIYYRYLYPIDSSMFMGLYLLILIVIPLILFVIKTYLSNETKKYREPANLLKIVMLSGVLFCFLLRYFFSELPL